MGPRPGTRRPPASSGSVTAAALGPRGMPSDGLASMTVHPSRRGRRRGRGQGPRPAHHLDHPGGEGDAGCARGRGRDEDGTAVVAGLWWSGAQHGDVGADGGQGQGGAGHDPGQDDADEGVRRRAPGQQQSGDQRGGAGGPGEVDGGAGGQVVVPVAQAAEGGHQEAPERDDGTHGGPPQAPRVDQQVQRRGGGRPQGQAPGDGQDGHRCQLTDRDLAPPSVRAGGRGPIRPRRTGARSWVCSRSRPWTTVTMAVGGSSPERGARGSRAAPTREITPNTASS